MRSQRRSGPRITRTMAVLDPGLVAWMRLCGIEPESHRIVSGKRQMTAAVFMNDSRFRLLRDKYYRTCLYGRHPDQDVEDVVVPDLKPSALIEAYREALIHLRDQASNTRGANEDEQT